MRHIIRRLIIFPIMLLGIPLLYFVAWCLEGHKEASQFIKSFLTEVWG